MKKVDKKRRYAIFALIVCFAVLIPLIVSATVQNLPVEESTDVQNLPVEESTADWELILVNYQNPLPKNYKPELTELQGGHAVDSRIYPELQRMFDDARAEGIMPMITSSYRTEDDQRQIMSEKISEYLEQGYSHSESEALAQKSVAMPGTSEHQLGMAVDISTADQNLQDASVVWNWLDQNSYRYGFILRYPEDKSEITGIIYEPWHFRYVGKKAAREIYEQGICLEEYLDQAD